MTKSTEQLLGMQLGGATVAENLKRAIDCGDLIENEDGTLELGHVPRTGGRWLTVYNAPPLGCEFLLKFTFRHAYASAAVPYGCRECYKVKVAPRTLREMVAAWQIAKRMECLSKWGIDLGNPFSQDVYAGYFYATGLEAARALFKVLREAFSADAKIGFEIPMRIKRGCSEYEAALGPSDRYEFTSEMAEIESYLKSKFREREGSKIS